MWRKVLSWEETIANDVNEFIVLAKPGQIWRSDSENLYIKEPLWKVSTVTVVGAVWERDLTNENKNSANLWRFHFPLTLLGEFELSKKASKKLSWEEPELNEEQKAKANILYAIYCAEAVLPIFENKFPNDNRPRLAIEAAKICLKNPSEENKNKARADAYAAAARAADAAYAAAAWAAWAASDAAWAAARAADAAYAAAARAAWAADAAAADAWAADAAANAKKAAKEAKKAAKEANIDIDFDSLLSRAQSDIWEYINISKSSNTSEASKASLKVAWEGGADEPPIDYFEKMDDDVLIKEFNDFDQLIDVVGTFGMDDLRYRQKIAEEMAKRKIDPDDPRIWTNKISEDLARRIIERRQRTATVSMELTPESILRQQIVPGDFVIAPQTFKDNTDQVIFNAGKNYTVLDYFQTPQVLGVKVQSEVGPWTITFRPQGGIASQFSWRKKTPEEEQFATIENNPFVTDILNVLAQPKRPPMTVQQVTDRVQQEYLSEGGYGHLTPAEFKVQVTKAWSILFHLGYIGMVQKSDKVSITPEGKEFLAS
jgi:hypothetical protein